ncbi:MAG: arsenate reductase (glutaredoxin) [Oligoflexales bacterium]
MSKFTIYHNPRCSKSRQTLELLRENGVEPQIVEYLKTPFTKSALQDLLTKLGCKPSEILRNKEPDAANLKGENDTAILNAMVKNPVLVERPIVVSGSKAVVGRPPENVLKLLK